MIISCIISFVVGAILMMCAIGLMSYQKDNKPRNKVHFYVTKDSLGCIHLWIGKPRYIDGEWVENSINCKFLGGTDIFYYSFSLYPKDYFDMKDGDIKEVYINLEDCV